MERPRRGDRAGLNEVDGLLTKAERAFGACEILLREGHADSAASRVYYGYFYVAEALLLSEGLRFSSHGQVVGQYGQRFAKTDALDRRYGRLLARAFALRQLADYGTAPDDVEPGAVEELLVEGRSFLEAGRGYVARRRHGEDAPGPRPSGAR